MCIVAQIDVIQDNRVLNYAVISHIYVFDITEFSISPLMIHPLAIRLFFTQLPDCILPGQIIHFGIDSRILAEEIIPYSGFRKSYSFCNKNQP